MGSILELIPRVSLGTYWELTEYAWTLHGSRDLQCDLLRQFYGLTVNNDGGNGD